MSPDAFEAHLRRLCDAAYARPVPPHSVLARLLRDELPLKDARQFWGDRWNAVLVLSQYVLPNLIRRCPDFDARVAIWPGVAVEYGNGDLARSHPVLYQRFLTALGVPAAQCSMRLPEGNTEVDDLVARVEAQSWHELLGRFLGRESVGPKVFTNIEVALARNYGLSAHDLVWFSEHNAQDQEDADIVFALCRRYGASAEEQKQILSGLQGWFDESPYCYQLGQIEFSYAA